MSYDKSLWFHWVGVLALGAGCSGELGEPGSEASSSENGSDPSAQGSAGEGEGGGADGPGASGAGNADGADADGSNGSAAGAEGSGSGSANADGTGNSSGTAGESDGSGSADGSGSEDSSGSASGSNDPAAAPVECTADVMQLGSAPMRRLSSREYLNTLSDLFPGLAPELPMLPIEDPIDSFDNDARALGASDVHVSRWEEIAFRYTRELTSDRDVLESFLPCAEEVEDSETARACGAEFIESFGLRTHRRPLSEDERTRFSTLFDEQLGAIDFEAAVQLTAMAMLQSPWFLYRLEVNGDGDGAMLPLDGYEVAARLSYLFWQRMPDAELFEAAASGQLADATGIEAAARRMLADPRAEDAVADFHRQWLFFDRMLKAEHDTRVPELFPDWNTETQLAAHEELSRFVKRTLFEGGGTLSDLLLSTETEVTPELAEIYGVEFEDGADDGWSLVNLPESERAGLLTRVGFLAAHAHSANGSPPLRGVYVMQRLFCMPPAPPPPDADTSPPYAEGEAETNRQLFEERTAPPDCQGCHIVIDAFGFGFEHYDAIGAYRALDNGNPVDAVVDLVGTDVTGQVDGAIELSQRLAQSEQVASCAVSRWYRYARGRTAEERDRCQIERLNESFAASGGNIIELLVALATSPEFRHRPVETE